MEVNSVQALIIIVDVLQHMIKVAYSILWLLDVSVCTIWLSHCQNVHLSQLVRDLGGVRVLMKSPYFPASRYRIG